MSKFLNFLMKLQKLPEKQRLIIMWSVVGVVGFVMAFFWLKGVMNTFNNYFK